jgi:hypothetical protein
MHKYYNANVYYSYTVECIESTEQYCYKFYSFSNIRGKSERGLEKKQGQE